MSGYRDVYVDLKVGGLLYILVLLSVYVVMAVVPGKAMMTICFMGMLGATWVMLLALHDPQVVEEALVDCAAWGMAAMFAGFGWHLHAVDHGFYGWAGLVIGAAAFIAAIWHMCLNLARNSLPVEATGTDKTYQTAQLVMDTGHYVAATAVTITAVVLTIAVLWLASQPWAAWVGWAIVALPILIAAAVCILYRDEDTLGYAACDEATV